MLTIHPIPAFNDNYIWAITDADGHCVVVDPGDAAPVQAHLQQHCLSLTGILLTHHHFDHTGGVKALVAQWRCDVYGPQSDKIDTVTVTVDEGDVVHLAQPALRLQVMAVPGHTLEHLAFYSEPQKALFAGDTLFAGGCGRVFEGTPEQMLHSLDKLAALPGDTRLYCAHEYTQSNLCFGLAAEPDNAAIRRRYDKVRQLRKQQLVTLPSLLQEEKQTNVFLRVDEPDVVETLAQQQGQSSRVSRFAQLREWKNTFICKE